MDTNTLKQFFYKVKVKGKILLDHFGTKWCFGAYIGLKFCSIIGFSWQRYYHAASVVFACSDKLKKFAYISTIEINNLSLVKVQYKSYLF